MDRNSCTVEELAERWGVTPATIRRMIADRKLKSFRVGRLVRISMTEVDRHEKEQAT